MASQGHDVQFYERDAEIVDAMTRYALEGLRNRAPVLVVATAEHRAALDAALSRQGVNLQAVQSQGRFVTFDAADTLRGFMVGDRPKPELFEAQIGGLLDSVLGGGRPIWVYGEMVALLCARGNVAGAMELESLWNDLAESRQFSLLCGYPASMLDSAALEQVAGVCESHAHTLPPTGYRSPSLIGPAGEPMLSSKVFVPADEAIGAARYFVARVLRGWGQAAPLIDDAVLLTSEMATNALVHAQSPFRISVARSGNAITFAIQDTTSRTPQTRTVDARSASGRGMGIVAALSSSWGCDVGLRGKIVWAELTTAS